MSRKPDMRGGPRHQLGQAREAWRIVKSLVRSLATIALLVLAGVIVFQLLNR